MDLKSNLISLVAQREGNVSGISLLFINSVFTPHARLLVAVS